MVYGAALEKRSPKRERGFESHPLRGEVLEWPIRRAWRARVAFGDRGFESHPLRFFSPFRLSSKKVYFWVVGQFKH